MNGKLLLLTLLLAAPVLSQIGTVIAADTDPRPGAEHASDTAKDIVGDDLIARGDNPYSSFGPGMSWQHNGDNDNANNKGKGTAPYFGDGVTLFR
ncbi:MAG: hypothetical protein WBF08_06235 [Candidatus Bathyarchaeia archaeon]